MKNADDLRVRKTRANIRNALITLLKTKAISEVSVKEICTLAMCSRNTFYMHYAGKEEVLEQLAQECVAEITGGTQAIITSVQEVDATVVRSYTENIIGAAARAKEQIIFLLGYGGGEEFARRLSEAVYDGFRRDIERLSPELSADWEYQMYYRYFAGGIVNFMISWMRNPEITEEKAVDILCAIHTPPALAAMEYALSHAVKINPLFPEQGKQL